MKKLLSVVAAALVALTFVGCVMDEDGINWNTYTKDKQNKIAFYAQVQPGATLKGAWEFPDTNFFKGDGTEGAIRGADNNYKVDYTNNGSAAYREYQETALKHAGALIKVTYGKESANLSASKMGVIFDLKDSKTTGVTNGKDFYVVGIGANNTYYVSKFTNIVDIQAYNFGATTTATGTDAKEVEIVALPSSGTNITLPAATDEGTSVYVYYKLIKDGSFDWAILDLTAEQVKDFKGNKKFNAAKLEDYTVLAKGNTLEKAGAEYEEAKVEKGDRKSVV